MSLGKALLNAIEGAVEQSGSVARGVAHGADNVVGKAGQTAEESVVEILSTPSPRLRRTREEAALAREAKAEAVLERKRKVNFQSLVNRRAKAIDQFDKTYVSAKNRGSISNTKIDSLWRNKGIIDDLDAEIRQYYDEGFEADYPNEFIAPKDFSQPYHYAPPKSAEQIVQEAQIAAARETPPGGLDLGGNGKNFGDKNSPGYQDKSTIERNMEDATTEYKSAAQTAAELEQARRLAEDVHRVATNTEMNPTTLSNVMNNGGAIQSKIAQIMSFTDQYAAVIGDAFSASKIMSKADKGIGSSAMHHKGVFRNQVHRLMAPIDELYGAIVDFKMWDSKRQYKTKMDTQKALNSGLTERLLVNAQEFRDGLPLTKSSDKGIQGLVDAFEKSGINAYMVRKLEESGVATGMSKNPFKIPVRFSNEKMESLLAEGKLTLQEFHYMMGRQIVNSNEAFRVDPLTKLPLTDKQVMEIGKAFRDKLIDHAKNGAKDTYQPVKAAVAVKDFGDRIDATLNVLFKHSGEFSEDFRWDFKNHFTSRTGNTVKLTDLLNTKVLDNVESFADRASGSYGLANSGLLVRAIESDLDVATRDAIKAETISEADALKGKFVPINSEARFERFNLDKISGLKGDKAIAQATEVTKNAQHMLFGRATGESISPALSASSTLASMIVLANSGIYNIVDWGTMAASFGALNVLGTLIATLPSGKMWRFVGGKMTKEEMEESLGILTASNSAAGSRAQPLARFVDVDDMNNSRFYDNVAYLGQRTPHANGSELVRRMQLYTMSRIIDSEMMALTRGKRGRKSLHAKLTRSGVTERMIAKWSEGIVKFGRDTSKWTHEYNPSGFEAEMASIMDKTVLKVTGGELPGFLQNSSVGKAILPFMAAQLSLTNNLLRNTVNQGAVPMLELLAYQSPLALLAVYLKEGIAGRDPNDLTAKQLIFSYLSSLPTIGGYGLALNLLNQDEGGRGLQASSTAFTAVNNLAKFVDKLANGEATVADFSNTIPLWGINPVVKGFMSNVVKP